MEKNVQLGKIYTKRSRHTTEKNKDEDLRSIFHSGIMVEEEYWDWGETWNVLSKQEVDAKFWLETFMER